MKHFLYNIGRERILKVMGDEHDAAEAAWWDEMSRPSLEELDMRQSVAPFQRRNTSWLPSRATCACGFFMEGYIIRDACERCGHFFSAHISKPIDISKATKQNTIQEEKVSTKDQLLAQARATEQALARLQDKIAVLSRFPDEDPCSDGDVIYFEKKFRGTASKYKYVGIKIGIEYHLSGRRQAERTYTWDALVEFMGDGVDQLWVMDHKYDILTQDPSDVLAATPDAS